jgi:AraC-like DNA-binding protein
MSQRESRSMLRWHAVHVLPALVATVFAAVVEPARSRVPASDVVAIAEDAGFSSRSAFHARYVGVAPGAFRRAAERPESEEIHPKR